MTSSAVILAGGLGTRLRPLTDHVPKPMIEVNGRPILERVLCGLASHGFRRFFFAVNYKAAMIEDHFGTGSRWGVSIEYLRESRPLGTAGALTLLPASSEPILVMNADLLTDVPFRNLMAFHRDQHATATMCVRRYEIPYGVAHVENGRLTELIEKPTLLVNAGVYVLGPAALDVIPRGAFVDMPDVFESLIERGQSCATYTVSGKWLDVGRLTDLRAASLL